MLHTQLARFIHAHYRYQPKTIHNLAEELEGPPPMVIPTDDTNSCCKIQTPLVAQEWKSHLQDYPNHKLTEFFWQVSPRDLEQDSKWATFHSSPLQRASQGHHSTQR